MPVGRVAEAHTMGKPKNAFWALSLYYTVVDSPVGDLLLAGTNGCLSQLSFLVGRELNDLVDQKWTKNSKPFSKIASQLEEYFGGTRHEFDCPIEIAGSGSGFYRSVWNALREIPYGTTRSYREIAERIGRPRAYRAVGQANHQNPIAIVIPCHRVIGSDGTLTGFGGGLEVKEYLLRLEKSYGRERTVNSPN